MEMQYIDYQEPGDALRRLNEFGAQGWRPAWRLGRLLILYREDAVAETLPQADIENWRDVYPLLTDEELAGMDADTVEELMSEDFELPTRATLNRWAQEARESVE